MLSIFGSSNIICGYEKMSQGTFARTNYLFFFKLKKIVDDNKLQQNLISKSTDN